MNTYEVIIDCWNCDNCAILRAVPCGTKVKHIICPKCKTYGVKPVDPRQRAMLKTNQLPVYEVTPMIFTLITN